VQKLWITGFRPLTPAERAGVEAEGAAMLRFLRPGDTYDIRVS
jgi:hypothetical protein